MAIRAAVNALNGFILPTTTASAVYTVPLTQRVQIVQGRIVNFGTATQIVNLWVLQFAQSVVNENKVLFDFTIAGGEFIPLQVIVGEGIEAGGTIYATADAANTCSISLTVTEFTNV